jgi:hypothetical protein
MLAVRIKQHGLLRTFLTKAKQKKAENWKILQSTANFIIKMLDYISRLNHFCGCTKLEPRTIKNK